MHSYGQYCPVARAAEIRGDRWTLLIVRDLVILGTRHFNDFERGLPGISRALLSQRLRRLQEAGIIERRVSIDGRRIEYHPTPGAQGLQQLFDVLVEWSAKWAFGEPKPDELDPVLLMWWMRGRIHLDHLPLKRVVVQFDFRGGVRTGSYWLVMEHRDVSVCLQHPGFDIDLLVTADIAAFYQVWLGRITLAEALEYKWVQLEGIPALVRAFPTWFAWSPAAEAVRTAAAKAPPLSAPSIAPLP